MKNGILGETQNSWWEAQERAKAGNVDHASRDGDVVTPVGAGSPLQGLQDKDQSVLRPVFALKLEIWYIWASVHMFGPMVLLQVLPDFN